MCIHVILIQKEQVRSMKYSWLLLQQMLLPFSVSYACLNRTCMYTICFGELYKHRYKPNAKKASNSDAAFPYIQYYIPIYINIYAYQILVFV